MDFIALGRRLPWGLVDSRSWPHRRVRLDYSPPVRLHEIAERLGTAATSLASLASLRLDAIQARTRKDLLDVARWLELKGASRMPKNELAKCVLDGLRVRARAAANRVPPRAQPPKSKLPKPKPKPKVKAKVNVKTKGNVKAKVNLNLKEKVLRHEEDPSGVAKLDLGPAGKSEKPVGHIPWGYGHDRVVAAAVDPDRLYVYWEVKDTAIDRARSGLGPGGPGAWLNLRVHDTTGLLFDGTNAHSYFDQRVDRADRQWFFTIGKPTSTTQVEIGMKSTEGFFVRIARSGRVEFPRKEAVAWNEPEWLTVLPGAGEVHHSGKGMPVLGRSAGAAPVAGASPGVGPGMGAGPLSGGELPPPFAPIALWRLHESGLDRETRIAELLEAGWERVEWREEQGEGWYELQGRIDWMEPITTSSWESGPFRYPVEVEPPVREEWRGPTISFKVGGVTHVILGPWQVVIRNLGAHQERAVLGRWEMYRSWVAEEGVEIRREVPSGPVRALGASERLGASEQRWLSGSELRLAGASELWRLGASELRLGGASEVLFAGASERRLLGASERRLGGASERHLGGASERHLGGSEPRLYPKVEDRRP
jgi:hypothetical protein